MTWDEVIRSGCRYCWWKRADAEHPATGAKWEISRPDGRCPVHAQKL